MENKSFTGYEREMILDGIKIRVAIIDDMGLYYHIKDIANMLDMKKHEFKNYIGELDETQDVCSIYASNPHYYGIIGDGKYMCSELVEAKIKEISIEKYEYLLYNKYYFESFIN